MNTLKHPEASRAYVYPDGSDAKFYNIVKVGVTQSGYHKLEDDTGMKYIVAPGWRFIRLVVSEWSF